MASGVEMWFYHLERTSVLETLPPLLEKCVERGWRAIVRSANPVTLDAIDTHLWTYRADSWLPHAKSTGDPIEDDLQPILLAHEAESASVVVQDAPALFLLDGADWIGATGLSRIFVVFDGRDQAAVVQARTDWKRAKVAGFELAYWQQSEDGKWART